MLTVKEEEFCRLYAQTRNGTRTYRAIYARNNETMDSSCTVEASKLLRKPHIAQRIKELIDEATKASGVTLTVSQIFERFVQMALADPNELIGTRIGCCRYCHGAGHRYQWKEREYLEALDAAEKRQAAGDLEALLPDFAGGWGFDQTLEPHEDCPECRGEGEMRVVAMDTSKLSPGALALYGGVKKTRQGYEVIIADRSKALENAARILGAFKDNVRLDGSIEALAATMKIDPNDDPNLAAQKYQEFIRGMSINR